MNLHPMTPIMAVIGFVATFAGMAVGRSTAPTPPPCPAPTTLTCRGEPVLVEGQADTRCVDLVDLSDCTERRYECPVALAPDVPPDLVIDTLTMKGNKIMGDDHEWKPWEGE